MLIAGIGGGLREASVALADAGGLAGVCPQERATRVRGAGVNSSGLPDEAFDLLLERLGHTRAQVDRTVLASSEGAPHPETPVELIDHHYAHACTAYFSSPFSSAAVVVCDRDKPEVSVWAGEESALRRIDWRWEGRGFARTFSEFSAALGFLRAGADQRAEALARLRPDSRDTAIDGLMHGDGRSISCDPGLQRYIADRLAGDFEPASPARARLAASLHARLGDLLVGFLRDVRERLGATRLCLGGTLFYHSSMNTRVKRAGLFTDVFVPVDPGDSGLAVGAAMQGVGAPPSLATPFLGPRYSAEDTKRVLDNCKLQYSWESEEGAIAAAVTALQDGRMVGWFDGSMEWGQRALGARCILANPMAPYVLENLNQFLKRREHWRGYALSGLEDATATHFDGPARAPYMECDFKPREVARFREALPSAEAAVRVHTVSEATGPAPFRRLLEVWGERTGVPFLVNTSFNGFHEPIVCSPRDAVRVFYGTGLDVLILNQFVLRK